MSFLTDGRKILSRWLEDKNYVLSTSIHESFGYGIAEAMARGIKPIIHDFPYAYEIWGEELLFRTVDEAVGLIRNGTYMSPKSTVRSLRTVTPSKNRVRII
jgi:glycosyltransferase involved in cell wall biosynthesis